MPTPRRLHLCALLCSVQVVAWSAPAQRPPMPQAIEHIASCVSDDQIRLAGAGASAFLDAADHQLVRSEMLEHYPVVATDATPSTRTILWQKPSGDLIYVAVFDDPGGSGQACFTATFAAQKFVSALLMRRKYLVPQGVVN